MAKEPEYFDLFDADRKYLGSIEQRDATDLKRMRDWSALRWRGRWFVRVLYAPGPVGAHDTYFEFNPPEFEDELIDRPELARLK